MQKVYVFENYGKAVMAFESEEDALEAAKSIAGDSADTVRSIPLVRNCTAVTYRALERAVSDE